MAKSSQRGAEITGAGAGRWQLHPEHPAKPPHGHRGRWALHIGFRQLLEPFSSVEIAGVHVRETG